MARPMVPDADKRRTIPLRLTKPIYRGLAAALELTGVTIQEQVRIAVTEYLRKLREELRKDGVAFPSEIWLSEMTDDQFNHWLQSHGNRPQEPKPAKRGGLRREAAQPAA